MNEIKTQLWETMIGIGCLETGTLLKRMCPEEGDAVDETLEATDRLLASLVKACSA
jgi:hypothetical protein